MCGLSGIVSPEPFAVDRLLAMHALIPHRGPDGEGFLALTARGQVVASSRAEEFRQRANGEGVVAAFAFRWLQIQDRDEDARQPMGDATGRVWICMNGEVYNFLELRQELEGLGHRFGTRSDTEVALAAYRQWGAACFERLRGMWSMLILDLERRRLVVSRDRFGIKPLCWSLSGRQWLFASEAKQIACSGGLPALDLEAVAHFCRGSLPAPEQTYFETVRNFPAAHVAALSLDAPSLEPRPYWTLGTNGEAPATFELAVGELDQALQGSMREHLRAAVPIGTLLSGGLDSSLVTAIATQLSPQRVPAFSFVLHQAIDRRFDESPYINAVVQAQGARLESHRTSLTAAEVIATMPSLTRSQESPVTGLPVLAQYATHRLAAQRGIRVVLDGQGADEVFGGYLRHQTPALLQILRTAGFATFGREFAAVCRHQRSFPLTFLRQSVLHRLREHMILARSPAWFRGKAPPRQRLGVARSLGSLDSGLLADITRLNLPRVLGITDRNSMAHSIEARIPFLDHRIVELAFRLPATYKLGAGERKHVVRQLARRYLPSTVTDRTDSLGFGTPQMRWMQSELRNAIGAGLAHESLRQNPLFDQAEIAILARRFREGEINGSELGAVWSLYALSQFFQAFPLGPVE